MNSRPVLKARLLAHFVFLFSLAVITSTTTFAQGARGTIRGDITDPNGAVVPGATVKLIDAARQLEIRVVQTDESGSYQFLEVDPGTYNILVTAASFAETRLTDVKVEPNRNLQLDVKVSLGTANADVTVTAT